MAILTLFCCVLSGCSNTSDLSTSSSSPFSTEINSKTSDLSGDSEHVIPTLQIEEYQLNESYAQQLDVSPLHFTEVLGSRKRYENSLPVVTGFQYPYVFYERMSAIVEGTTEEDPDMFIGRYSVETQEVKEFPLDHFLAISDEACLTIDQNRIVYMYCSTGDDGNMVMKIMLFDFLNNSQKLIATYPIYNVFGYAKKLSDDDLIFFLYESVESGAQQILLLYNLPSNTLREIYRSPTMGGYQSSSVSTKDIWAINTNGGNIDLLMQQFAHDVMHLYLRTIDRNGVILNETELEALSMYSSVKDTADSLVTKGNYIFIHFSQFNKDEDNTNFPSAILYRTNTGYELLQTETASLMDVYCGNDSSSSQLLAFSSHRNENIIYLFDTTSNKEAHLTFLFDGVQDIVMDIEGNVLVQARVNEESLWYLFPSEYISGLLSK